MTWCVREVVREGGLGGVAGEEIVDQKGGFGAVSGVDDEAVVLGGEGETAPGHRGEVGSGGDAEEAGLVALPVEDDGGVRGERGGVLAQDDGDGDGGKAL